MCNHILGHCLLRMCSAARRKFSINILGHWLLFRWVINILGHWLLFSNHILGHWLLRSSSYSSGTARFRRHGTGFSGIRFRESEMDFGLVPTGSESDSYRWVVHFRFPESDSRKPSATSAETSCNYGLDLYCALEYVLYRMCSGPWKRAVTMVLTCIYVSSLMDNS